MQADAERSGSIGATLAEVEAYVELVMGRRNMYALIPTSIAGATHVVSP